MKRSWASLSHVVVSLASAWVSCNAAPAVGGGPDEPVERAQTILGGSGVRGGLIVHLGCGDGTLTAALASSHGFLVQGLDADAEDVAQARKRLQSLGVYGRACVDQLTGTQLPYIDGLVNLLVVDDPGDVSMDEVIRVLRPNGVAYTKQDGQWQETVKPWPRETDQWSHFLHDASGNAVARDRVVGPPRRMQWMSEPVWARHHHYLASISAVVSAGGRVFFIADEGPAASMRVPARWSLVARDAFNGVRLWQRRLPTWSNYRRRFRSGPVQLPRRLVATGDQVYVTLGLVAPVVAVDAATGKTLRTYAGSEGAEEIVCHDGILLVARGDPKANEGTGAKKRGQKRFPRSPSSVGIGAFDCSSGRLLWKKTKDETGGIMPLTLASAGQRAFFQNPRALVCLNVRDGGERWRSPRKSSLKESFFAPTLVVGGDVVLSADGKTVEAFDADSGRTLWTCPGKPTFRSPVDVFVIGGVVWIGPEFSVGRDLHTGEVKRSNIAAADLWTAGHHHRCYRNKATERYILTAKRGVELFDLISGNHSRNNWVRGVCQYGVMPANGLIYAPSHACACYVEAKLYGFWALGHADQPDARHERSGGTRLRRGPAYAKIAKHPPSTVDDGSSAWPTYRHDALRSGSTSTEVPLSLRELWQADIGGRLSAPVVTSGSVLVASIDAHRVVALSTADGKERWSFTVGGRVDSPPTVYRGLALFGCADGWVYCLRASDGVLVWRFRAAPEDRRAVARDQIESVWPVHGSVLMHKDVAYVSAGRSSYLDGGIHLYGLDPHTGRLRCQTIVRSEHPTAEDPSKPRRPLPPGLPKLAQNTIEAKSYDAPDTSDAFAMGGARSDVLVSDGASIYLRHLRFDENLIRQEQGGRHLYSTTGLLDGSELHRTHLALGTGDLRKVLPVSYSWIATRITGGFGARFSVPYGLLLVFDDQRAWGVRRTKGYVLFAEANKPFPTDGEPHPDFRPSDGKTPSPWKWSARVEIRPRAMLRAGSHLLIGGMPDLRDGSDRPAAFEGQKGGLLLAASLNDGTKLSSLELPSPPVYDGMVAAGGRLYLATANGKVLCLCRARLRRTGND